MAKTTESRQGNNFTVNPHKFTGIYLISNIVRCISSAIHFYGGSMPSKNLKIQIGYMFELRHSETDNFKWDSLIWGRGWLLLAKYQMQPAVSYIEKQEN